MGLDKIIHIVGLLAAVVFAFVAFDQAGLILTLIGLVSGYFIAAEDRNGLFIAVIALSAAGVAGALGGIPEIGGYLAAILGGVTTLYTGAAVTAIVLSIVEKVKP